MDDLDRRNRQYYKQVLNICQINGAALNFDETSWDLYCWVVPKDIINSSALMPSCSKRLCRSPLLTGDTFTTPLVVASCAGASSVSACSYAFEPFVARCIGAMATILAFHLQMDCCDMTLNPVRIEDDVVIPLCDAMGVAAHMCMESCLGMFHNELVRSYRQLGGPDRVRLLLSQLRCQMEWGKRVLRECGQQEHTAFT